ncbi:MAG: endonuclease Q family protein [Candidatus Cloacimonetes bacterium]|nr:endonuclease Q family protein [Candidatus Cloacimonadota bacterium]
MTQRLIADLHIHSHFSLATSKELVPEMLDWWARRKGINLLGSGDISHPGWLQELKVKLEPAEPGLYKLKKDYQIEITSLDNGFTTRFVLTGEMSSIYKDKGKTRKIHQLFLLPDMQAAFKFQNNLENKGVNIRSDGRPICGLSARNLLELALETDERIYCIPAHVWTPWFSLFGARSGYDALVECYDDLSDKIHTLETGLSADVPMMRLVSALDIYGLISSSDAHSPAKLGRNATIIKADLNWDNIIEALQKGDTETIDFYPEIGKYHFDGHRKCDICLHPRETAKVQGLCPVCGKPLTTGVLNRVYQLADRTEIPQNIRKNWQYLLPLAEILSIITGKGINSKKVQSLYNAILDSGNRELELILEEGEKQLEHIAGKEAANFLRKYKESDININPGYDGVYGKVR